MPEAGVPSDRPFAWTLRKLMAEHHHSLRSLAAETRKVRNHRGLSHSYLGMLSGGQQPSMVAMETIAKALGVKPTVFAEYRLGLEQRRLNPQEAGFQAALKRLQQIEKALGEDRPNR